MRYLLISLFLITFSTPVFADDSTGIWGSLSSALSKAGTLFNSVSDSVKNKINSMYGDDTSDLQAPAPSPIPVVYTSPSPLPPPDPMIAQCQRWGTENSDVIYNLVAMESSAPGDEPTRAPCLEWLLSKPNPPAINGIDPGLRPLFLAMDNGFPELAKILIAHGADVNLVDERGLSPLYIATDNMEESVASALLSKGADPNKFDTKGAPPLFSAVAHKRPIIVRALLDHKADPNLTYSFGSDKETALDTSAENLIVLKSFVDDQTKPEDSRTFAEFQVEQMELDNTPKVPFARKPAEPMRNVNQLMIDAQAIDKMLIDAHAKCATQPCGGVIGASASDLSSDATTDDRQPDPSGQPQAESQQSSQN